MNRLHSLRVTLELMETKHKGLDSIERRRTLSTILKIPPVLLGLGSLDQIVEVMTGQGNPQKPDEIKRTNITKLDIEKYQKAFSIYNALFVVRAGSLSLFWNMISASSL